MKRERLTVRKRIIKGTGIEITSVTPERIKMSEIRPVVDLHNAKGKGSAASKVRSGEKVRNCDKANSYHCDKALIKRKRHEKREAFLLRKAEYLANH